MGKPSMTKIIRDIFEEKKQVKLDELYRDLSEHSDLAEVVKQNHLKHRIRSCIYSLAKSNVIERTQKATYQLKK